MTAIDRPASPFLDAPIGRTLAKLAVPGIAASVIQASMSFIEAYFVGGLGPLALASVALVFPIFMLANMLSAGAIGGAVSGATARALGAGDQARAEMILRLAVLIALVGGAVMAALMLIWGGAIFRILGGDGPVLDGALAYSGLLFAGIVVVWLNNMTAAVIRGSGNLKLPAKTMAMSTVLHLVLSVVLVGGVGPVDGMGLRGAALALVLAYASGALIHLVAVTRPGARVRLRLPAGIGGIGINRGVAVPVLRSGLTAGLQSVVTIAIAMIVTGLVGRLGITALAGYGIGVRLELLMIPIIFGVGSGSIAMVGANVGAGQRDRAISIAWRGALATAAIVGAIGIAVAIHPPLWTGALTDDAAVAATTATYLRIVGPFYGFFGLGLALYFASQGLDSLVFPVIGTLVRLLFLVAGGALLTASGTMNEQTLFAVVAGAMTLYGVFIVGALKFGPWRRGRRGRRG